MRTFRSMAIKAEVQPSPLRARDVGALAPAAGLFAALGNTALVLSQMHVFNRASSASPDFAFLAPIGYLTVFVVVAAPLVLLGWLLPARLGNRVIPGIFAAVSSFALLSLIPRVHPMALLLIAIGIGARVGWAFEQRARAARQATLWLAGAVLCRPAGDYRNDRWAPTVRSIAARGRTPRDRAECA